MRLRLLAAVSLCLALPAFAGSSSSAAKNPKPAPAFSLPTRTGTVSSDSLRGKVVLVDFWASWCVPCRKSFPWMAGMYQRYRDKGLVIVAINLDKTRDPADQFVAENPAPFLVAYDPSGKTAEAFHVSAMPSSFLVDTTGTIIYSHPGFDPKKTGPLEKLIQEACAR
jgi:cytochrome c biogenesis protein CcmG/thiol:disulfide interchange protein DsbE